MFYTILLFSWLCPLLVVAASPKFGAVTRDTAGYVLWIGNTPAELNNLTQGKDIAAWGSFNDTIDQTGWSTLSVFSNGSLDDHVQAYAAGFLEGGLTAEREYQNVINLLGGTTGWGKDLENFIHANREWVDTQVSSQAPDPFWYQVGLLYRQLDGLYDGYLATKPQHAFSRDIFHALTLTGDMDDLCSVFRCSGNLERHSGSPRRLQKRNAGDGHCSVLIKVLGENHDILIGHTTWTTFESMLRVYKLYDLPFKVANQSSATVPARRMTFSSYPGCLYSNDDFYQTSAGLAIVETTIENNNDSLWQFVTPQTIMDWARNMVANRLARSGADWVKIFPRFNSGTYNNEFMILDYNLFKPGEALAPGTLFVLEQMPGTVVSDDLTEWLATNSYWASYNRPYFPVIYNLSGQLPLYHKYGDHFSWSRTARAQIFAAGQASVTSEETFRKLMRHNDFMHDAISNQGCTRSPSASNAISERGDLTARDSGCLDPLVRQDEAGIDCKYTSSSMMPRLSAWAQSGPTFDNVPPFVWSTSPFAHVPHLGIPDHWEFPWVQMNWE